MRGKLARRIYHHVARRLGDTGSVYLTHFWHHRRLPDFARQERFTDRMAYRKLYPSSAFSQLADKISVRKYVIDRLGENYVVPLLGYCSDIDDFNFEELPSSFVMKASHGAGWNEFVRNKDLVDVEALRAKGRYWLSLNYHSKLRERHYRNIPARVLFEKLLLDHGKLPRDYKVHCFRKKARFTQIVQVVSDRFEHPKVNYFTSDGEPLEISQGVPRICGMEFPGRESLCDLLATADILSRGFNYVRVDLYLIGGRIYFGEMTFTPNGGLLRFTPRSIDASWAALFERDDSWSVGLQT